MLKPGEKDAIRRLEAASRRRIRRRRQREWLMVTTILANIGLVIVSIAVALKLLGLV